MLVRRTSQLGFVAVAAGAAAGPAAPIVIGIALAGMVALKFLKIGAGRKEADYLTKPGTGAQWIVGEELRKLIDEQYVPKLNDGTLTEEDVDNTIQSMTNIQNDFVSYASQFKRAGKGAIATITRVIGNLIADRVKDKQRIHERNSQKQTSIPLLTIPNNPLTQIATPQAPQAQSYKLPLANSSVDSSWWLLLLLIPLLDRKRH